MAISGLQVSKVKFIEYCDRNPEIWGCGWLSRGGVYFSEINADLYDARYLDSRVSATIAIDPALAPVAIIESALGISTLLWSLTLSPMKGSQKHLMLRR